jgi:primosomal protein N' (replication factor Y)
VTRSLDHDFEGFAECELENRRSPVYPPFCRLVNVIVSGRDEEATQRGVEDAANWLKGLITRRGLAEPELIGPAPCPIERIRDRWRWHFLLRAEDVGMLGRVTRFFAERFRLPPGRHDLRLAIDRDPVALL